jgi:hypothetical protein
LGQQGQPTRGFLLACDQLTQFARGFIKAQLGKVE